jgi:hypothetical protein
MRLPFSGLVFLPLLLSPTHASINWDIYEKGVVKSFRWMRSFPDDGSEPGGFEVHCRATGSFNAKLYRLSDLPLQPPLGLAPWHDGIEDFLGKLDYMGSWDGVDHKGQDREIVMMEWVDVPEPVRHWIEEQQRDEREENKKRWFFGVFQKPKTEGERIYTTVKPEGVRPSGGASEEHRVRDEDKIVVFPGAAAYEVLPLWVSKGSRCEREYFPGFQVENDCAVS